MIPSAIPKKYKPRSTGEMVGWVTLKSGWPCGQGIMMLPTKADHTTAAVGVHPSRNCPRLLSPAGRTHLAYGTVQAFETLEASAVVAAHVEPVSGLLDRARLNVALMCPSQRLIKLAHSRARAEAIHLTGSPTMLA